MNWQIEALQSGHDRTGFCSGEGQLDDFLKSYASQHSRKGISRTYVATAPGSPRVLGYYTLSSASTRFENLPINFSKSLPGYPVPVLLLGKLAVDVSAQGRGLGQLLLVDALRRALQVSTLVGVFAVTVDALNERATRFYRRYGFIPFQDHPHHLFLPIKVLGDLLE